MKNFEMAHSDNPDELIKATQRAMIASMKDVLIHMRQDLGAPGLTWEQLDFFLEEFKKKEPVVIKQANEF